MKILLVAPKNPESFWTFDAILKILGKRSVFPNLALPTVAALTPPEHEVVLCDENVEPLDFDCEADLVGITGYIVHRQRMLEIAGEFRRRGKFVVIGGPYASLCPEELAPHADSVFVGEAERAWSRFLRDYSAGAPSSIYQQENIPDLHDSPCPRFDLLKTDRYRSITIQFSRGCPYNCEFCDVTVLYGRRPRTKLPEQLLAELDLLRRLAVRNVFVTDDNFVGNKREAKAVLEQLIAWQEAHRRPVEFQTQVSINVARDDELLDLLRRANFTSVFVGIESPRPESLQEAQKSQNLKGDLVQAVHHIQSFGIEVMAGMIVGFDHDDASIFDEHLRFIQEASIPISMTGMLNAIPGTALYGRLRSAGRLVRDNLSNLGDQFAFTNVIPAGMSSLELYQGYRRLLERLYSYRSFRQRALRCLLRQAEGEIRPTLMSGAHDLGIFLRMLWTCVLRTSPGRSWMTVSLLLNTAIRRPSAFRSAVTLALIHLHLHRYVRHLSRKLDDIIAELKRSDRQASQPLPIA